MDERSLPLPIELQPDEANELADAAFRENDEQALEQAHRALYALYADRIWRNPNSPNRARLEWVRAALEEGFREQLDHRREEAGAELEAPSDPKLLARWFELKALGPHAAEDGRWGPFIREEAPLETMHRIVAQRSLFFLREPDPWVYAIPTLRGIPKAGLIDVMLDEYGWGKLDRMHSSVYARVMDALGLNSKIDHYESETSWQFLATLNHQWMCATAGGLSRRLIGTIFLTEIDSPGAMRNYLAAWERLGIEDPAVLEFYDLHVEADENHSAVALNEIVLPICAVEGSESAAEIAKGICDARALEADFAASEIARVKQLVA